MDALDSAGRQARHHTRRATNTRTFELLTRTGLVCRALLYTLIGLLAFQIVFSTGSREADDSGAINALAREPFGLAVLWIMLVGFAALAIWQAAEALAGAGRVAVRLEAAARTVFYSFLVLTLARLLFADHNPESGDQTAQDLTAGLLELPAGQLLAGAIGVGILALGGFWLYTAATHRYLQKLHIEQIPSRAQPVVRAAGLIGNLARGLIAGLAGGFFIYAAATFDPAAAKGVDATLRAFSDTPFGPWLLAAIAAGLLCFALYCLAEARWHRT